MERKKKELVPSLVPLHPCQSVVITTYEAKVFTKTGVRDGSVLVDQSWAQWVITLLPLLKCGNLVGII